MDTDSTESYFNTLDVVTFRDQLDRLITVVPGSATQSTLDRPNNATERFDYRDMSIASNIFHENNDCAVRAVGVVTNNPYPKIHELFRKMGRRNRCGTHNTVTFAVLRQLGFAIYTVTGAYPGRTVRAVLPTLPRNAEFLIQTSDHILAVVNGKTGDFAADRGLRVVDVFEIVPQGASKRPIPLLPDYSHIRWTGQISAQRAIWNLAEAEFGRSMRDYLVERGNPYAKPPYIKRWWLSLRARVHAQGAKHGLKASTMSVELGKWQASLGYKMKELG